MKKIICQANDCLNQGITYFMPIQDKRVQCGGCKLFVDAITMTEAEITATFDYDYKASDKLDAQAEQSGTL